MTASEFQFDERNLKAAQRVFSNRLLFKLALLLNVPMDCLSGMRIKKLNLDTCHVTVPYRWLNKNPFQSTFWAVLGMAAEMSCGALVMIYTHKTIPSVSVLVGRCSGEFVKKATDTTTFVCNDGKRIAATIKKTIETTEPQEVTCQTTGYSRSGEEVSNFSFTWKMKARST